MRYGIALIIIALIIPREKFKLKKLKGMMSYPLFISNSKNVEKEKRRCGLLRLFDGLKGNLKSLSIIRILRM